jgi:hypothetical protein
MVLHPTWRDVANVAYGKRIMMPRSSGIDDDPGGRHRHLYPCDPVARINRSGDMPLANDPNEKRALRNAAPLTSPINI